MSVGGDRALDERIEGLLLRALGVQVSGSSGDLIEAGLLDSLGLVELLFAIEQEFHLEVPLHGIEIDDFRSVERIAAFVARLQAGEATAA